MRLLIVPLLLVLIVGADMARSTGVIGLLCAGSVFAVALYVIVKGAGSSSPKRALHDWRNRFGRA